MPAWIGAENFEAAARRHLDDAAILFDAHRFDNAVYLAGYVAECSLKARLAAAQPAFDPGEFSHRLDALSLAELLWNTIVLGSESALDLAERIAISFLSCRHPERRYWPDTWDRGEAESALDLAAQVYGQAVLRPILDEGRGWGVT